MKLLLTGAFKYSEEQLDKLKLLGFDLVFVQDERMPLQIDVSDIDAVVCNGLFLYNDIMKFKNLKFIQLTSAGLDRVPLNYIKENEISLFNAKGIYSIPMAEWVVLNILGIYKKSRKFYDSQRDCKWEKQKDLFELTDKTASIIGFGSVGLEIAKRLKAFNVNIIGIGRTKTESAYLDQYYLVEDLNQALKKSDIVISTLPLTKETRHLIDKGKIDQMKSDSVLINVSRGGVIDETALIQAIQHGKFLGVALDVFQEEPLSEKNVLWTLKDVTITPHNSFVSDKTNERLFNLIISNLKSRMI
ncbi:hypothetical protein LC085_09945 [Bacillus tianshenii]|uniref:NAD(P)-dependent oxidoreductase n=1 Tax=Sutcliffiella tianshenii TaxID=1463404 RepID=UPI001CD5EA46|nr:NAD(P)-dependent oxidoreductase [Bacillus tianshenii]MCA1320227.1 hypothetical protein [Bacillus tianshenii]